MLLVWASLAINYSNLPWVGIRLPLALAFLAFGIGTWWFSRRSRVRWIFAGLSLGLLVWWSTIRPSHDRPWRPAVALRPRVTIDGDRIRITGFRNFEYRTRHDFTVRLEEREYLLSHLIALDFYVSYGRVGPVGHTFVSFIFDNAPPMSISIETRPEVGEGFAPIASLFKQFELIYVIGDARGLHRLVDAIRGITRRSNINEAAQAGLAEHAPDFSERIRVGLPQLQPYGACSAVARFAHLWRRLPPASARPATTSDPLRTPHFGLRHSLFLPPSSLLLSHVAPLPLLPSFPLPKNGQGIGDDVVSGPAKILGKQLVESLPRDRKGRPVVRFAKEKHPDQTAAGSHELRHPPRVIQPAPRRESAKKRALID